ncbi:uncharacterized protein At1g51745 isoform X1 [Triticum aestivum]|uniref:uncharacterized protein At1g51745 isoform X1 n=1 Tax=Triticum aestivum TaxID=4565 RepID=UPI001D0294C9|nr:uncharacterized protein At1g51745-like isoform X1 [Triticum aestivum]
MGGGSEGGGDADEGCCSVGDTSPGTIVWVRRRNGSWWPGRILGQSELPPSQIMSPRSGTPVKLLGREDASVDWYNLEKSKRVKAFRCGEFDACIERAEATQGTLSKKREKYARREDAILHALELERKLHQTQGFRPAYFSACTKHRKDLGSTRYKSKKRKRKDVSALPAKKEAGQYFLNAGLKINFSESQSTSENLISNHIGDLSHVRHIQGGASLESKENCTIVKKNRSDGSDFDESIEKCDRHRPLVQVLQSSANLTQHSPHNDDYGAILIGGDKDPSPATYRAKRSICAYLPSDSGETHSHSDLPSAQMVSTGADFDTESYLQHPDSSSEEHTSSDFVEKHVSESSERECSESETEDDTELLQSANRILPPELRPRDPYFLRTSDRFGHVDNYDDDDDDNEVAYSAYMHQLNQSEEEDGSSEQGVSRWHIKGKRNNRSAVKKSTHMTDGKSCLDKPNGLMKGSVYNTNGINHRKESVQTSDQQVLSNQIKEEPHYDSDETDLFEGTSHPEVNLYHSRTYPSSLKATRDLSRSYIYYNDYENDSSKISPPNWDTDQIFRVDRKAYWDEPSFYQRNGSSRLGRMGPMLFDIDLKVQASYHGEHVPLVSLMSRLDGKAIVGHPIQIEILVDGSTDHLVSGGDISMEESTGAPTAWHTGRRTAMQRIPRSNPLGASMDCGNEGRLAYSDWEMKPVFSKYSTSANHQVKDDKKSMSNSKKRSSASKSQKKPSKKASLSSQKVRTLSSIPTGRRHHEGGTQAKPRTHSGIFGDLIKPDGAIPPVTCVPAKVVFTRILEAVGRPPLAAARRVRMVSPEAQDPT